MSLCRGRLLSGVRKPGFSGSLVEEDIPKFSCLQLYPVLLKKHNVDPGITGGGGGVMPHSFHGSHTNSPKTTLMC